MAPEIPAKPDSSGKGRKADRKYRNLMVDPSIDEDQLVGLSKFSVRPRSKSKLPGSMKTIVTSAKRRLAAN